MTIYVPDDTLPHKGMAIYVPDDTLPHKGMAIYVPDDKLPHVEMTIQVPDSVESSLPHQGFTLLKSCCSIPQKLYSTS